MRLNLRQKLLGAFAIDLLLMMALGTFAWYQMGRMNSRALQVETLAIPALRNVDTIHDLLGEYRRNQLEYMIYTNPADKARLVGGMVDLEKAMDQALTDHAGYQDAAAGDPSDLEAVRVAWRDFVVANHESFLPALRSGNTGSVQPAFTRLEPLYARLMSASLRLADRSEQQATLALTEVRRTYQNSRIFILTETALTLAISAGIGLALTTSMVRRIRRLTSATRAVARGDLERSVEVPGEDELAVLGQGFDHMVSKLREKRATLEQRNQELGESLERQRQLTEDLVAGREAEAEALRAKTAAEAASEAKSFFLATMSHELRTPLNAILGYAQILQLEAQARGQSEILPELARIQMAGKHLLGLISNVLDFSKIEQGKLELAGADVEILPLAREVVMVLEPLARQNGNRLRLDGSDDLGTLHCDAAKLRQVLFNLLSNAVKFTEDGEITLSIERRAGEEPAVTFAVADTGIGIHDRDRDKLFQAFSQIEPQDSGAEDSAPRRRFDGTGLGLVVSQQLCQAMGGAIHVESTPGEGSTFTARFPVSEPPAPATEITPTLRTETPIHPNVAPGGAR